MNLKLMAAKARLWAYLKFLNPGRECWSFDGNKLEILIDALVTWRKELPLWNLYETEFVEAGGIIADENHPEFDRSEWITRP